MSGDTVITVVGNLVADPGLRSTRGGTPVCNFVVASTPRVFNRDTMAYEDGEALFMRCTAWNQLAVNVAESLKKGVRVVVNGWLKAKPYTDPEGQQRLGLELEVDAIGPDLRFATARATRRYRDTSDGSEHGFEPDFSDDAD